MTERGMCWKIRAEEIKSVCFTFIELGARCRAVGNALRLHKS
jgi:hypothetical protein